MVDNSNNNNPIGNEIAFKINSIKKYSEMEKEAMKRGAYKSFIFAVGVLYFLISTSYFGCFDTEDFLSDPSIYTFITDMMPPFSLGFSTSAVIDAIYNICLFAGYEIKKEKIKLELERFGINYDEVEKEGGKSI